MDVIELLKRHFGAQRPHSQSDDVSHLIVAIAAARSDEARCGGGHVSKKDSIQSLRAMLRLADDDLIDALKNCDIATFGRIQDAQFILICDEPSEDGVFVDADGKKWTSTPRIELPSGDTPPYLPMGFEGLRRAIKLALERATGSASVALGETLKDVLDKAEANRNPQAGNKEKPHLIDLARACAIFWNSYGPAERQGYDKMSKEGYASPKTRFAKDAFGLAGVHRSEARIAELLGEAKISN